MLIILEGPDCAGKTTLAQQLHETLDDQGNNNVSIWHRGPIQHHPLQEYEVQLFDYEPNTGDHIICDRWHLGEAVYGPIMRGRSELYPAAWRHIDLFLASKGVLMVHLRTSLDTVIQRYRDGDRAQYPSIEQLEQVHTAYETVFRHIAPYARMNLRTDNPVDQRDVERILMFAHELEVHASTVSRFPSYVGPPNADVLLLGDTYGPGQLEQLQQHKPMTCFMPYEGTSGLYLLESIPWVALGNTGIANAKDENVHMLQVVLSNPIIVALGYQASSVLEDGGIQHGTVEHPQYVRRFHHHQHVGYSAAILDAAVRQERVTWLR